MNDRFVANSRRNFLKFIAGSPLFAYGSAPSLLAAAQPNVWSAEAAADLPMTTPAQALNVFDLEAIARRTLPPAHFAYLATGVENDATIRANRAGFAKFQIRARRLVDTSKVDMRAELFGTSWPTPIALSPVSSLGAFHEDGEIAVAQGRPRAQSPADRLDAGDAEDRRHQRSARIACVVPALSDAGLEHHARTHQARRIRGLHRARTDRGQPDFGRARDARARTPARLARLLRLPRQQPGRLVPPQADVRRSRRVQAEIHAHGASHVGLRPPPAGHDIDEDSAEGHRDGRRRGPRGRASRGRRHRVESWRTRRGKRAVNDRGIA